MITQANGMRMAVILQRDATGAQASLAQNYSNAEQRIHSRLSAEDLADAERLVELQRKFTPAHNRVMSYQATPAEYQQTQLLATSMRTLESQLYAKGIGTNDGKMQLKWVSNNVPPELAGRGIKAINYEFVGNAANFKLTAQAEDAQNAWANPYSLIVSGYDNDRKTCVQYNFQTKDTPRGTHDMCGFEVANGNVLDYVPSNSTPTAEQFAGSISAPARAFLGAVAAETGLVEWMVAG